MAEEPRSTPSDGGPTRPGDSPQVFRPRANLFFRAFLIAVPITALACAAVCYEVYRSPMWTGVTVPIGQPVLFSHRHHAGELKIDCRYCHTSVEKSGFAGVPPTQTCMTCHSQLFVNSPLLTPVRESFASGQPIRWNRVHDLPDYVYFDHSVHVEKGVGCSTCHGRVDDMPLVWKDQTLFMQWCLNCHRHPEANLRPAAQIYDFDWKPGSGQLQAGATLAKDNHLDTAHLTNCSVCHQ